MLRNDASASLSYLFKYENRRWLVQLQKKSCVSPDRQHLALRTRLTIRLTMRSANGLAPDKPHRDHQKIIMTDFVVRKIKILIPTVNGTEHNFCAARYE